MLREAERAVTVAHAEAVAAFIAQNRISLRGYRHRRLPRPDRAAPPRAPADGADRRCRGAGQGDPYSGDARLPRRRRRGRRAGRALRAGLPPRAGAVAAAAKGRSSCVNIGGVSNITYIDGDTTLIACDTGPGNALLDDFMYRTMRQALRHAREGWPRRASADRGLGGTRAGTAVLRSCRRRNRSTATILPR